MYIVPPLWSHILWLYWGRNDSELVLWPVERRLISGWAFAQFLRLIRVLGTLGNLRSLPTHRKISRSFSAKFRGVSPRNVSANFCGVSPRNFAEKTLGEISVVFFFLCEKQYFAQGVYRGETRKRPFFLGRSVHVNVSVLLVQMDFWCKAIDCSLFI